MTMLSTEGQLNTFVLATLRGHCRLWAKGMRHSRMTLGELLSKVEATLGKGVRFPRSQAGAAKAAEALNARLKEMQS